MKTVFCLLLSLHLELDCVENKGAHNEYGPPTHKEVDLEYQIQPMFVKGQLLYKKKYSWAF